MRLSSKPRTRGVIALVLAPYLAMGPAYANESSQRNVPAAARGFNGGGGVSEAPSAGNMRNHGGFDGPGARASSADGRIVLRTGSVARSHRTRQLFVAAASSMLQEQGSAPVENTRTSLGAIAYFDDDTAALLPGDAIHWEAPAPGSALESIASDGLATAATVPEDTAAAFTGRYAGLLANGTLWVVNSLSDNHGVWAGDGFDDQWQIANGIPGPLDAQAVANGIPFWMHYAFSRNPLLPDGGAFTSLKKPAFASAGPILAYTRNPLATGVRFIPETTVNSLTAFTPATDYIEVVTPEAPDRERVEIHFAAPSGGTSSQYFRLRVVRDE